MVVATWVAALVVSTLARPGFAQEGEAIDPVWLELFPEDVLEELGAPILAALTAADAAAMHAACPQDESAEILECLLTNNTAAPILKKGMVAVLTNVLGTERMSGEHGQRLVALSPKQIRAVVTPCSQANDVDTLATCIAGELDKLAPPTVPPPGPPSVGPATPGGYAEAALAVLPGELLDKLPKLVTRYLRDDDWRRLGALCPAPELAARVACLDSEQVAGELSKMVARGIMASMLTVMDAAIPERLSAADYTKLAASCDDAGEPWAECVVAHGGDDAACVEAAEPLASCLARQEVVAQQYLSVREDKKRLFGDELYLQTAGLLSYYDMATAKAVRAACPQKKLDAALACFGESELTAPVIAALRGAVEQRLAELSAGGAELDRDAYTDRLTAVFLTMPLAAVAAQASACGKKSARLAEPRDADDLDALLVCMTEQAQTSPLANPAFISKETLRDWLARAREKVLGALTEKETTRQSAVIVWMWLVLLVLAVLGGAWTLSTPLRTKAAAGQRGALWKTSVVAALTLFATVGIIGTGLSLSRLVQASVALSATSPRLRVAEAAFDVLEQDTYVEAFSELSKTRLDLIKEPLRTILELDDTDDAPLIVAHLATHWSEILEQPELRHLAKNAAMIDGHVKSFRSMIATYESLSGLFEWVPLLFALLAVMLYLVPLRETLVEIARAPARVAAGETAAGTVKKALRIVWAETRSIGPYLVVVLLLLPITGYFLASAIKPLVEMLLGFSLLSVFYILLTEASSFVLYATLGSTMLLLVYCLVLYIASMVLFTMSARRIIRAKYHFGHTFRQHKRFWLGGTACFVGVMLFGVIFVKVLGFFTFEVVEPDVEALSGADLMTIPALGAVLFPALFWAARGFKALALVSYRVPLAPIPESSPSTPQSTPLSTPQSTPLSTPQSTPLSTSQSTPQSTPLSPAFSMPQPPPQSAPLSAPGSSPLSGLDAHLAAWTLEHYAAFSAERRTQPEHLALVCQRYHVRDPSQLALLDALWAERLREPGLRGAFEQLLQR